MGKIKLGKLNAFDLIVIVLICICLLLMAIKFMPKTANQNVENSENTFSYVIRVEGISKTSGDMLKVGDRVFDKISNTYIGEITDLNIENAMGNLETLGGTIVRAEMPGKIDVDITVTTEGNTKNGEYIANNLIRILVGQTKQIKTKYWMASGMITEIK